MTMLCPCYDGEAAWVLPAAWAAVSSQRSGAISPAAAASEGSAVDPLLIK